MTTRVHAPTPLAWQTLGNHLREARAAQRVSQEFLAIWLGVSRDAINRIERGNELVRVAHLSAMELALGLRPGVSLEVLAGVPHAGRPHHPAGAPTLLDLSTQTTLCGHNPPCH